METRDFGDWIEIRVADQGIGMSEKELESLFKKFFRAKNDLTARVSGSGLGLYLTKYFVEAHSGEVRVSSEVGRGSTFTIRLRTDLQKPLKTTSSDQGATPGLKVSTPEIEIYANGES